MHHQPQHRINVEESCVTTANMKATLLNIARPGKLTSQTAQATMQTTPTQSKAEVKVAPPFKHQTDPPVILSQITGGDDQGSNICQRMIGKCPVAVVKIGGIQVTSLLDTESQVTTIREEFFNFHYKPKGKTLLSTSNWLMLTAANGLGTLTLMLK